VSNWTSILILSGDDSLLKDCNDFLNDQYTPEKGWESSFQFEKAQLPGGISLLTGYFPYFHDVEFVDFLVQWLSPKPIYHIADDNEPDGATLTRQYIPVNDNHCTLQMLICREHDSQFWLMNITKAGATRIGDVGVADTM